MSRLDLCHECGTGGNFGNMEGAPEGTKTKEEVDKEWFCLNTDCIILPIEKSMGGGA